jgi:hypothetical protein
MAHDKRHQANSSGLKVSFSDMLSTVADVQKMLCGTLCCLHPAGSDMNLVAAYRYLGAIPRHCLQVVACSQAVVSLLIRYMRGYRAKTFLLRMIRSFRG